jgi:uncharacterized membrane protein (TIGR02234 family)
VGAGLVLGSAGRVWATVEPGIGLPGFQLTGRDLSGVISALGWAGLAGTAVLLVTRGWARALTGVLIAVFGLIIAAVTPVVLAHGHVVAVAGERSSLVRVSAPAVHVSAAWPAASLAGGVLLAAAGILTALWGRRWPGLSARYDRPGAAAPEGDDPVSLWKAIDRGEDPTSSERKER